MSFVARHKKKLAALAVVVASPYVAHLGIDAAVRFEPANVTVARPEVREEDGVRRAGRGFALDRGKVRVVALAGTPEEIGAEHTALNVDRMTTDEAVLWDGFVHVVPFRPARTLLFDLARVKYRHVEDGFPEDRRRELAAEAKAFTPDPYAAHLPTYTRMVFLHALYDIALGFEHSPLLACTAFGLGPEATADGHVLFGRAFDFEAADVFDLHKAVFVVREDGKIPFASVAWPGFVGVVTGMNAEGVAVEVNGGRAREPSTTGMPVAFSLREALAHAHDTGEAIAILSRQPVMVSHIVFVGDAKGRFAVVERAPGVPAFVRETFMDPNRASVTNHFEGPLSADPKDAQVRATSTTLARRARIDELLGEVRPKSATVESAIAMLRDHRCAGGVACPLGDRRAIDAFIATHGVVFDLTTRAAWVSEGPHLSGRFVKIDLPAFVTPGDAPPRLPDLEVVPPDEVLSDGRYAEGRARAGGPMLAPRKPKEAEP
jgi:hypothetical protein